MQVQVLFSAPQLDTSFDTMRIEAGVLFLFTKTPISNGFLLLFNYNRLYDDSETITIEPVSISTAIPVNERSVGCTNFK